MSAETPAAVLKRAADKLRALAAAATPPPWTATPRYRKGTQTIVQVDVTKPPLPGSNVPQEASVRPSSAADALYGAAMDPGVGVALADWLESTAATVDAVTRQHADAAPADAHWLAPALAVAGAVLGEGAQR